MPRLVLALEYPLMQQGGTEVLVRKLLEAFAPEFEITLISADRDRAALPAEYATVLAQHFYWDSRGQHPAAAAARLAEELQRTRPDLIHWHLGFTYAWRSNRFWQSPIHYVARSGVPSLCTIHSATEFLDTACDLGRPAWQKFLILLRAWPSRGVALRAVRREVCVSRHDERRLRAHFPVTSARVTQIYHSLLDTDGPPPPPPESRGKRIVCLGTIGGRKAQHLLAEAFCRIAGKHPAWQLEIIGPVAYPEEAARIEASMAKYGAERQVHLPGALSHEAAMRRLETSAIYALPSLHEGLGLSLQEALFHGCVAVGSDAGGIPELIDHERNGLLFPPGNVDALSAALDRLMADDALRLRMAGQARRSIIDKAMTASSMLERYRRLYRERILPA